MKKLALAVAVVATLASCKSEPKDYVTFSGKITNPNSDKLTITTRTDKNFKKVISVNEDGTFSDTLKVKEGIYVMNDGKEYATLFLANGADIKMTLDTKEFDETIKFTGQGSEKSQFGVDRAMIDQKLFGEEGPMSIFKLDKEAFNSKLADVKLAYGSLISKANLDSAFTAQQEQGLKRMTDFFEKNYDKQHAQAIAQAKINEGLKKGMPSPTFDNYENHKGGTTSLSDLKGKYVYVDVWATWCGPCKAQIPSLKKVEKQYHGKNIEFVSISVDNVDGKRGSHEKWKKMVTDKQLGGIQLYAPKDWSSDFIKNYGIRGIPRFILIDPNGNIVDANAPRPSEPRLIQLFNDLKI